jgi:CubicO group peptidase (beta-lactamase class C family)
MRTKIILSILVLFITTKAFTQTHSKEIDSLINAYVELNKFNGTVLVNYKSKTIFEKAYGYQDAKSKIQNSTNGIYQIGSLTKSFTALIILKLVEEGKISLKDPINKYILDYPLGNEITVEHLLTHTSGIYETFRNPSYFDIVTTNREISTVEKMSYFMNQPLDFKPGTKFSYSNSGYILLGIIIEKITGLKYHEALNNYILKPNKMRNSGFDYQNLSNKNKTISYAYLSSTKQVEAKPWNPNSTFSSGAMYSTTSDLLKWYKALTSYKIISKNTFENATNPFLKEYGYGWFIDSLYQKKVINHGGNVEGATSYFLMLPEDNICIVLLNNITNTKLEKIGNSILAVLLEKPYTFPQLPKEIQLDTTQLNEYIGNYVVSNDYKASITRESYQLFVQINQEAKMKISAKDKNNFFITGEDIELTFIFNEGKQTQLKIRQGLHTRVGDKQE